MPALREVRVRRLLSMRQLAKVAGVAPTTVYLIESGQRRPHFETMRKLAAALEVEPGEVDEFRAAMAAAVEGKGAA